MTGAPKVTTNLIHVVCTTVASVVVVHRDSPFDASTREQEKSGAFLLDTNRPGECAVVEYITETVISGDSCTEDDGVWHFPLTQIA